MTGAFESGQMKMYHHHRHETECGTRIAERFGLYGQRLRPSLQPLKPAPTMNVKPACVAEAPTSPAAIKHVPARRRLALANFIGLLGCALACCAQNPPAAEPLATNAPGVVIPLIQFQDTSLTTAIETLARQAGLNHIMD